MNGILQDRPGSGSRPIETLTSSRATTASYALVAETIKDGSGLTVETASYALVAKSVEASGSLTVETASYAREAGKVGSGTSGSSTQPVFWSNGIPAVADEIPTAKTGSWEKVAEWVTENSASISSVTGSSIEPVAEEVGRLTAKSESWDNAATWLGDNSASIGFTASTLTVTASYGKATEFSASWNPSSSNQNINITVPVSASHVGAVAVENFEEYTASVSGVYVPVAGGQISGNLVVAGDLTVNGTITGVETPESVSYATSASEAIHATSASEAVHAISASNVVSASYASSSTSASYSSYALIAESVKEGGSLVVETASYAHEAASASQAQEANYAISASEATNAANTVTASYALVAESLKDESGLNVETASYALEAERVTSLPSGAFTISASAGAFVAVSERFEDNRDSSVTLQFNVPTNPGHIGAASASHNHTIEDVTGLSNISASVDALVNKSASWDGAATTASAAQQSASLALTTASSAQQKAENASASAALLYKATGSATQPVFISAAGPAVATPYASASVLSSSYALSASFTTSASRAVSAASADAVVSASYALVAESVKDISGLTASYALEAKQAGTASFLYDELEYQGQTYSYSASVWDLGTAIEYAHHHNNKTVLDGITAAKTASWDRAVSTASAAQQSASLALTTASKSYSGDVTPLVAGATTGTITLAAGKLTSSSKFTGNVTYALGTAFGTGRASLYAGKFTYNGNYSVTFPNTVKFADNTPDLEADSVYEFSILDGIGVMVKVVS